MSFEYDMKFNNHFYSPNDQFKAKWSNFENSKINFNLDHFKEELVPFYGTKDFENFTREEKIQMFFEYIKFVSEAFLLFEQLIIVSERSIRKNKNIPFEFKEKLWHIAQEEMYHSIGFKTFLNGSTQLNWKNHKIYYHTKIIRTSLCFIVKNFPTCLFLPGAKLEASSLGYYVELKKLYDSNHHNSWLELNAIHSQDEAHHVPMQFELHNDSILKLGALKTIVGSLLFFIALQLTLFLGIRQVVEYSFPQIKGARRLTPLKKWILTVKMAHWSVRNNESYIAARRMTKRYFQSQKPKFGIFFKYITW